MPVPSRRAEVAEALRHLAPAVPPFEADAVIDRALDSRGLRFARPGEAAWLALVAFVRHAMTDYEALLDEGYDVDSARFFVRDDMNATLRGWGVRREVSGDETEPSVDPGGIGP